VKTIKVISLSVILGLLLMWNSSLFAQDPLKAAPNVYKNVLLENDQVRVIQIEFAPGETAAWHQHPNHVIYALTNGKLEITDKGKPANVIELKAGTAMFMPAVTHMAKNIGTTPVKLVVMELKSIPK
jgi:quercetin dioxygenase-like cupin family protein